MTDPRLGDRLLPAIRRLPVGSGVIFRHYGLDPISRRTLFAKVRRVCARRGHLLLLAGDARLAVKWHADGFHARSSGRPRLLHAAPVHNAREIGVAKRHGADILLLSPVQPTASHPGKRPLGPVRFRQLAALCSPARVIALGGMNRAQAAKWPRKIAYGWAAIDAFKR